MLLQRYTRTKNGQLFGNHRLSQGQLNFGTSHMHAAKGFQERKHKYSYMASSSPRVSDAEANQPGGATHEIQRVNCGTPLP